MGGQAERVFPIFLAVWVVLGLSSAAFFFLNNNAGLKRRAWAPFCIAVGLLFLIFTALMGFPQHVFLIAIPAVALITILNIRHVKFCSACGKTVYSQNPFSPPKFCSKCGATLQDGDG